jgi:uncharacterized membrane protein YdbT with pleckstrin-like domain
MFSAFRQLCERVLRIPPEPEPPPGDAASTQIFRAAPNYYKYLIALWALKTAAFVLIFAVAFAAPLIAAAVEMSRHRTPWSLLFLIIPASIFLCVLFGRLFALAVVRLDFEKRWYVITDRSLRVREGVFYVREATVTFANIQNISISEGPIQRLLGIADLRVDTAGGGGSVHGQQASRNLHTAWFRGVNNAKEIRELMQQRLKHLKDAGLGDHDDHLPTHSTSEISPGFLAALREVRAEAAVLRQTVEQGR